jgi:hypothetical protein
MRGLGLGIALCMVMNACGGGKSPETTPDVQASQVETLRGTLALTGNDPVVRVTLRGDSESVDIVGPLRDELARLTGAVVTVDGHRTNGSRSFEAVSYDVVSVNGERPVLGTLVERDGAVWLEGDEAIRLVNVSDNLRRHLGAKMWIVGTRTAEGLQPESYGVIREP